MGNGAWNQHHGGPGWRQPPPVGGERLFTIGRVLGLAGLVAALLPGLAGWPYAAIFASFYLALVLLWHLALGRSWLNLAFPRMRRKQAALALPATFALFVAGGIGLPKPATSTPLAAPSPPVASSDTPTPSPAEPSTAQPVGLVAEMLAALVVRDPAPAAVYTRAAFGQAWADADRNGCDTRNDILRRDLTAVTIKPGTRGCAVVSGTLNDRYTGEQLAFQDGANPELVQVDHVVSLQNAWVSGADAWPLVHRESFANDPLNLLATGAGTNAAKRDRDAGEWLPPNASFTCEYAARQVAVKKKYALSVTPTEAAGLRAVLVTCPGQLPPMEAPIPLAPEPSPTASALPSAPPPTTSAAPLPLQSGAGTTSSRTTTSTTRSTTSTTRTTTTRATSTSTSTSLRTVTPGAYCSPAGALGVTAKGVPMICRTSPTDDRLRWRSLT